MIVFEKVTAENTIPTLKMAAERAKQDGVHLVVASTGGDTALKAVEAAKEAGVLDKLGLGYEEAKKISEELEKLLRKYNG